MPIKTVFLVCLLFQCFSCNNTSKREREIADIDVSIDVERFDILFSEATPKTLSKLMSDYPFMFSRTIGFQNYRVNFRKEVCPELCYQKNQLYRGKLPFSEVATLPGKVVFIFKSKDFTG